jgi:integrase
MLRKATPEKPTKPEKPYAEFPLTAHPNGQWCKKIKGTLHYFGPWSDPEAARDRYLDEKDELFAGREPERIEGLTVKGLMSHFLDTKQLLVDAGEIEQRSLDDYHATCKKIGASLGLSRVVDTLSPRDFQKLRSDLGKGKKKRLGSKTLQGELTRARVLFRYAVENGYVEKPLLYREALKSPNRANIRREAAEAGPRMFEAAELRALIAAAPVQLKAMIYLALNCGFGNMDCSRLTFDKIDLDKGWHYYGRSKTGIERRAPLWAETVSTIREAMAERPEANPGQEEYVFLTRTGQNWAANGSALSAEFRKLAKTVGVYRRGSKVFYSLRRSHETIGAATGQQVAVDFLMGHSRPDMASVYRQRVFDSKLREVTDFIRGWLLGEIELS